MPSGFAGRRPASRPRVPERVLDVPREFPAPAPRCGYGLGRCEDRFTGVPVLGLRPMETGPEIVSGCRLAGTSPRISRIARVDGCERWERRARLMCRRARNEAREEDR